MSKLICLEKIAEEIGNKHGEDYLQVVAIQNSLTRRLREAALNGELICFDGFGIRRPLQHEGTIFTTVEAVNDWFTKIESTYRYGDNSIEKPWLVPNPNHPTPEHEWWTCARYFALQHKKANDSYGINELWPLVQADLEKKNIYARGKKNAPPGEAAIRKALANIPELKKKYKPR